MNWLNLEFTAALQSFSFHDCFGSLSTFRGRKEISRPPRLTVLRRDIDHANALGSEIDGGDVRAASPSGSPWPHELRRSGWSPELDIEDTCLHCPRTNALFLYRKHCCCHRYDVSWSGERFNFQFYQIHDRLASALSSPPRGLCRLPSGVLFSRYLQFSPGSWSANSIFLFYLRRKNWLNSRRITSVYCLRLGRRLK